MITGDNLDRIIDSLTLQFGPAQVLIMQSMFCNGIFWDFGNICNLVYTIREDVVAGDDTYYSSSNCYESSLESIEDECIMSVTFYYT